MRRIFLASVFALSLGAWSAFAGQLTGVITCGKCKNTKAEAADCAKACIKGGVPAIFVASDGKTYKIANPDKIGDAINEQVTVTGSVKGDTLTIESVAAAKA